MSAEETARLQHAPHVSRRVKEHELQVGWNGGQRLFKDKPPFDDSMDGLYWVYCGYNLSLKSHLIGKYGRGDLFTGMLLDDRSGSLLPGATMVLFSPRRDFYLAYEQPDGQYGEDLKLYSSNGTMLWRGYSGFLSANGTTVLGNFENLHWDANNTLIAEIEPIGKRRMSVTLIRRGDSGQWEWVSVASR